MKFPSLSAKPEVPSVHFESVDVSLPILDSVRVTNWLATVAHKHDYRLLELTYVFCSDQHLLRMNIDYLQHDTLTDIITFDMRDDDEEPLVQGECYVSLERVAENAAMHNGLGIEFATSLNDELLRVMVHGLLHLCGLGDKTPEQAANMRQAEAGALSIY